MKFRVGQKVKIKPHTAVKHAGKIAFIRTKKYKVWNVEFDYGVTLHPYVDQEIIGVYENEIEKV